MYQLNNSSLLMDVNVVVVNFDDLDDCFRDNYVDFFKRHTNNDLSNYHMSLEILYYGDYSSFGASSHIGIQYFQPDDDENKNPETLPNYEKFLSLFLEDVVGFKPSMIVTDNAKVYIFTDEESSKDY